ncbi:MAG: DUF975 family protein [Dysgonamonadaceae bacterium]|jgi:uncharacterized membrane protein|nr:DUF975 family protein [Dysgonamonadaceae bacterium]
MLTNSELKDRALEKLREKWNPAVLAAVVYVLPVGVLSVLMQLKDLAFISGISSLIYILLVPVLSAGMVQTYLALFREEEGSTSGLINLLSKPFSDYGRYLGTMLLVALYTFLWSMLLLVPGIIKSLSYSLTAYILKDHPEMKYNKAIELSMNMMKGNKMKLFLLQLSFIGWMLLALIPMGLGLFWLVPYMQTTMSAFYEDVKEEYLTKI